MVDEATVMVCTRCLRITKENPFEIPIGGFVTCFFCQEGVITGKLATYDALMFESDVDELLVIKIHDGLVFHSLDAGEVVSTYKMHKSEFHELSTQRGNLYLQLLDYGFL